MLRILCLWSCVFMVLFYVVGRLFVLLFTSNLSLQFIPMPVLYGVFLYMGVASLNGVQVSLPEFGPIGVVLLRTYFHEYKTYAVSQTH